MCNDCLRQTLAVDFVWGLLMYSSLFPKRNLLLRVLMDVKESSTERLLNRQAASADQAQGAEVAPGISGKLAKSGKIVSSESGMN